MHHHTGFWEEHFIAKHIHERKSKWESKEKRKKKKAGTSQHYEKKISFRVCKEHNRNPMKALVQNAQVPVKLSKY